MPSIRSWLLYFTRELSDMFITSIFASSAENGTNINHWAALRGLEYLIVATGLVISVLHTVCIHCMYVYYLL